MKNSAWVTLISFLIAVPALAQGRPDPGPAIAAVGQAAFLEGEWSGEGWSQFGPGPREEFTVVETVEAKLDGALLLIEGIGHSKADGSKGHHAMAIVAWNPEIESLVFTSYLPGLPPQALPLEVGPGSLVRQFKVPNGGTVRYSINVADGVWRETGEYSPDGESWNVFLEMRLERHGP